MDFFKKKGMTVKKIETYEEYKTAVDRLVAIISGGGSTLPNELSDLQTRLAEYDNNSNGLTINT